ncbi:sigma 54-interacting transcriptional regulator [Desulfosporosinus sp. PR]|uniref:sigma-54 interaction domain-containing protein n=1 Tax=Candidatus Desulfosporosinus nitrosoreducens TaxID=3401928 RepID=UPI0027E9E73E|nr:sigma 54-interacting transcriptional regulator [Desulfosporosinus sp. PR]MDQ7095854.1 sigma 54-interacting transcriptional regulator [Desulfosporosinus sp. PR]
MKIREIMKPWTGKDQAENGISENSNVHNLKIDDIIWGSSLIEVTNDEGIKTGEVAKDLLLYLLKATDMWMLSNIMDNFQEAVIAIDMAGKVFYVNNAYSRVLGVSTHNVIGKQIQQIEPEAEILNVIETKIPIIKKNQYIKTLDKYVSVHIFPIEQDGELKAVASIFRDSTAVVKLGQEVENANEIAMSYRRQMEAQNELSRFKIIGNSPSFLKTVSQALTVAKTEASVLIKGENGVGKEEIAKVIYSHSDRKDRPMIMVNCAAIPESLIESELFGYEGGAFTGAKSGGKMGKFELANGGTLFLDEIGDMPLSMQSKLLRVLENREIEKIGRQKNIPVDIRLIAASNQPLEILIKEKKFRQDLYFRLNIVEIEVPSLRERIEDIGLLANYFLQKYNEKYGKSIVLSQEVLSFLYAYSWPGNVRELQNCMEYAGIMCFEDSFKLTHLPPHMKESLGLSVEKESEFKSENGTLKEAVEAFEKKVILSTISACGDNKSKAIQLLGLSRRTFYRKLKEYKIHCGEK